MGRIPDCGASGLDLFQLMRAYLFALVLLLPLVAHAAGYASAQIGGGASKSAGGTWSVQGPSASAANGAFNTPASVNAAGRQVTMPASASFAANAASFAVGAVRLNPAGLFLGAVLPWLLNEGLQWANNSWTKAGALEATYSVDGRASSATQEGACLNRYAGGTVTRSPNNRFQCWNSAHNFYIMGDANCSTGPAAVWGSTGYATCSATVQRPATDADFDVVGTHALPSDVAQQLARSGVAVPVNEPVLAPGAQDFDYAAPFVDPVTGKTVQTKTKVTPQPTAADPFAVRLDSYNVEVAPAPAPAPGDPVPLPKDEQPKDPCLDNPNRVGCMDAGSPEDVQLETREVPFSVNAVAIGGAGACPPDPVIGVHGMSIVLKLTPICDAAGWLRPLVLALAWFSAALIVGGAVRES